MTCKSTQKRIAIQTDTITLPITEYEQLVADANKWREQEYRAINVVIYGNSHSEAMKDKPNG
jgi:hypothetical protein